MRLFLTRGGTCSHFAVRARAESRQSQEARMNMPAESASASRHCRRRAGGSWSRDRTRPARRRLRSGRALHQSAADPEGSEPDPAHAGALPLLGRRGGASRGADDPARLRHRRHDGLRHAAERLPVRLAAARAGAALLLHRQRTAAAIRHRSGAAASRRASLQSVETALRLERRRHRAGRRRRAGRRLPSATAIAAARCGRTMWSAATAAARWCATPPASRRPCPTTTG